jgi:iron uptake system EfeUOB component EfeO/EfeM
VGCGAGQSAGGTNTPSPAASNGTQNVATSNHTGAASADNTNTIRAGIDQMLAASQALANALSHGQRDQVRALAEQLENQWHTFEDLVRPRYPKDYETVEQYLDPLRAGAKANPGDASSLRPLNDSLAKALQALKDKLG